MTTPTRPSFDEAIAAAADHQHVQQWQAAQTVRAHLSQGAGRDDVLECLGLTNVTRPVGR